MKDFALTLASAAMLVYVLGGLALFAVTYPPLPDDAIVVKICTSGDLVYRLADGRHAVPRAGIVDDVNTVCSSRMP
jgi:hypothetical protein